MAEKWFKKMVTKQLKKEPKKRLKKWSKKKMDEEQVEKIGEKRLKSGMKGDQRPLLHLIILQKKRLENDKFEKWLKFADWQVSLTTNSSKLSTGVQICRLT